jgi:hypothetical protein
MTNTTTAQKSNVAFYSIVLMGTLLALAPFFAQNAEAAMRTDRTERIGSSTTKTTKTVNLTCMQTAVGVRESAIMAAHDTYAIDHKAGLTARKTALNSAWGLTDGTARKTAIRSAWGTWRSALSDARDDLKTDKKTAWTKFKKTAKETCREVLPKEESPRADTEA